MLRRRRTLGAAIAASLALLLAACGFSGMAMPDGTADDPGDIDADDGTLPDSSESSLAIDRTSVDFGSITIGQDATASFTVTNTGTERTGIIAATIVGMDATEFERTMNCATLAPGASCTVTVQFEPTTFGPRTAALTVASTPGGSVQASLAGVGSTFNDLTVDRAAIDFGSVVVGQASAAEHIVVTAGSNGTGPLTVDLSSTEFDLVADACTGTSLDPGATCSVDVAAVATSVGPRAGTITIVGAGAGSAMVALSATAVLDGAFVTASPGSLAFPNTTVSSTSSSQTITVENAGSQPTGALTTTLTGLDFDLVSTTCDSGLAAGATCSVVVAFNPLTIGMKTGVVTVSGTPGGTVTVALEGTGVIFGDVSIAPDARNFGDVTLNTQSAPSSFTISYPGSIPTGLLAVSLTGAGAGQFQIASDGCTGTSLVMNGSCTVTVRFLPTALSPHTASLVVQGTPGGTDTASLTGRGIELADIVPNPTTGSFGAVPVGTTSAPQTFTIAYQGSVPTGPLSVTSSSPRYQVSADMCTGAMLSFSSCTFDISFAPSAMGPVNGTVTVIGTPGGVATIAVTGTGIAAALASSADAIAFGVVAAGAAGQQSVTITNAGTATSGPLAVSIAGPDLARFSVTNDMCTGQSLTAGDSCVLALAFAPTEAGSRTATLHVSAVPGGALAIPLDGTGLSGAQLVPNATAQAFGRAFIGTPSAVRTVTVTNAGGVTSTPVSVTLGGSTPSQFDLSADLCTGATLAPNATCTFGVRFDPTTAGSKTATISIAAAGASGASVALSGTGVTPADLDITPTMQDFGMVTVGMTSASQDFTISNGGGSASGPLSVSITGAANNQFEISSDGCDGTTLAPGTSCTLTVQLEPTSAGTKNATLRVIGTPGGTVTSALTGTAVDAFGLAISPSSKSFGSVPVGGQSADQTFIVTNVGALALTISSVMIGGTNPDQFEITMDNCTGQTLILIVSPSCTIAGRFAPSSSGVTDAAFVVTASEGPSATAAVSGTGI